MRDEWRTKIEAQVEQQRAAYLDAVERLAEHVALVEAGATLAWLDRFPERPFHAVPGKARDLPGVNGDDYSVEAVLASLRATAAPRERPQRAMLQMPLQTVGGR